MKGVTKWRRNEVENKIDVNAHTQKRIRGGRKQWIKNKKKVQQLRRICTATNGRTFRQQVN